MAAALRWLAVLGLSIVSLNAADRQLRIKGLDTDSRAMVVLLNAGGVDCKRTVVRTVPKSGRLNLKRVIRPGCWACEDRDAGIAIHATGRAVEYRSASELCGKSVIDILPVPRRLLTVHVWPKAESDIPRALDDMANTDWILDRNLAGITVRAQVHWPNEGIDGIDCNKPPGPAVKVPDALNVYYGGGRSNQSCETKAGETPYVLIHDTPVLGDLAHELGHALGLKHGDHEREYETGHTTELRKAGFDCSNSMWEGTEVITDHFSLGQAFWLHWSGSSWFAKSQRHSLPCSDEIGGKSPCPAFSTRLRVQRKPCRPCAFNLEEAKSLCRGESVNPTAYVNRLCTTGELLAALKLRWSELQEHKARYPEVRMGSSNREEFLMNWRKHLGLILTVEAVARTREGSADRAAGLDLLNSELESGGSQYLGYAIGLIKANVYKPRCTIGSPEPPAQLP